MEQPAEAGGVDEAFGGAARFWSDVDVIADEMEEGLAAYELARAEDGMRVAARVALGDKGEANGIFGDKFGVGLFISGPHDDANVIDAGARGFANDQAEDGALDPLLVNEQLHGKCALAWSCRCDDCLANLHREVSPH